MCEAVENKDGKSVHSDDVRWVQYDLCDHWCKAIRNSRESQQSKFPGILQASGLSKILCKIFTAKFVSFASVICNKKGHKCISHLHTLQNSRAGLTLLLYSDSHCTVVVMPYVIMSVY